MATLAPLRPEAHNSLVGEQQLTLALLPWRNRLSLQQALRWIVNGFIAGMLLACLLLLISRFIAFPTVLIWAIAAIVATLLCALGLSMYYRPTFAYSARRVDALLGLHDRLSTAWEYRDDSSPLPALQRRDALERLGAFAPASAISLRPGRARLLTLGVVALAFVLLLVLPNPVNAELQQQQAFQNSLSRQIAQLNHIRQLIDSQGTTPQQVRDQLDKILQQAMSQLQQAKDATQAQQILAQTQQKLNQLRDPQADSKANANAAAASTLQNSANASVKAAGKALATGDSNGLSNALQKLTSQVNSMTADQRAQLAQQIAQAANAASGNPQLASALQQLAKSIADGNANDIADATRAVENAAASASASQSAADSINQAAQALQNIANTIASSTNSGANATSNQVPNSLTPGQGRSPSIGQSSGQGSGGQGDKGSKTGKSEQVFVPGQVSSGTSTITSNGDSGTVQPGTSVSYAQVLAQYTQMAHDAIDNSNIPPDLKDIIGGYFDSLNGQK
jgi:membrane protein involved in colicin uptake